MNQDIIYEILRYLYLEGRAPTAKKILISTTFSVTFIESVEKLEKPVVFEILGDSLTLRLMSCKNKVQIYWGDDIESTKNRDMLYTHTYDTFGIHKIKLFGVPEELGLPTNLHNVYSIGNITNMHSMFEICELFNNPLILDTSKVTNMEYTFYDCKHLNQPLVWNTSKVTSMYCTFFGCTSFNQNLNWDTGNVTDLSYIFHSCTSFNQTLNWNTKSVKYRDYIFTGSKGSFVS